MSWCKRKRREVPDVPADVHEARELRAEAQQDLADLKRQSASVAALATRLIERRDRNHFGDQIQITFTPRGGHAR